MRKTTSSANMILRSRSRHYILIVQGLIAVGVLLCLYQLSNLRMTRRCEKVDIKVRNVVNMDQDRDMPQKQVQYVTETDTRSHPVLKRAL